MRKFTSFLLMLLCAVTTWAGPTDLPQITTDLENPIYYTISNTRSEGKLVYYTAEGIKDNNPQVLTDAYKFFFTGSSLSELKIHNAEAEKSNLLFTGAGAWNATGESVEICVTPYGDKTSGLAIKFKGTALNEQNQGRNGYTTWDANDAGSIFVIDLAKDINWPEAGKFYVIEAPLFESVQGVKKGLYVDENNSLGWNTVDLSSKNYYWTVEYNEGNDGYAVKNLATGLYLNGTGMSEEVANYAKFNYLSQYQFNIVVNGTTVHANNHGNGASASGNVVSWGGLVGSASAWRFVEKNDPETIKEISITYNFEYKGEILEGYTQTVRTFVGEEYPNITVQFPYGVSATKPEGTIAQDAETTITLELEENLPFKYAASVDNISDWYYVQMHSSAGYGKFLQYAETYIEWADATRTADKDDEYSWAFVGNPFVGFKMINYALYETGNSACAVVSNGKGNPSFGTVEDAVKWEIKKSRVNPDAEHFCFKYPNGDYMNAQSGKVAFWSDTDQGSTMWVTWRDLTGVEDLVAAIEDANSLLEALGEQGTTVGYITAESLATLNAAIAAANEEKDKDGKTVESVNNARAELQKAIDNLATIQPSADAFYTFKNAYSSVYMNVNDNATAAVYNGAAALNEMFQFVPADNDGDFYLYNVKRAKYLSNNPGHGGGHVQFAADSKDNAKIVNIKNLGVANRVSITPAGGATVHHDVNQGVVVGWNGDANSRSAWVIDAVANVNDMVHTLNVGEAGWSTLYLGCEVAIPDGVTVYYVSGIGNGYAKMEQLTDVIPAKTAVIIEATQGSYTFAYSATNASAVTNKLNGTTVQTDIYEDAYVLGIADSKVGLYTAIKNQLEGAAWLNNAFKAYLPKSATASQAAQYFSFNFGGGTTAIEGVEAEAAVSGKIYDITGREVKAITTPGIYIVGGKKVVVK